MIESLKCRCLDIPRTSQFYISEAKPHYAPDRKLDLEHLKLEIDVILKSKTLKGFCTQTLRGVAPNVTSMRVDAIDLKVSEVTISNGSKLKFEQDDKSVTIHFSKPVQIDERVEVKIDYSVVEPRAGLYFISPSEHYPDRPWQLWTQGQDQDNRYWIPIHDSPNEKATTEMIVTVDENYTAISNGKLLSSKSHGGKKTFHWKQSIPHASYLITLCVGEFVELKDSWKNSKSEEIPVQYFTLKGREEETKIAFGRTPKMLDFFSQKIGIDYPYEKYAQVVAWDFIYGGMENTSSTTQTEYTLHPAEVELDYSSDPLVAHELAHQWFGDLLTCKEWSHAWLNEGFATYFETLWTEHHYGNDEFLYELFMNEKIYKDEDASAYRRPIVTNVYMSPSDIFDRHLYEKGGRVLHMLRKLVGEELWWKAIQKYVKSHHSGTVETIDLQRSFEEASGLSLGWFFEQWIFKAGHPDIKADYEWLEDKKAVRLSITQKQTESDLLAVFRMPLQFKVCTSQGEKTFDLEFNKIEQSFYFPCEEKPKFVSLNPQNTVLGNWEFNPGRELLIAQLSSDSDIMGRIFAARSLSKDISRASVQALGESLVKEKFWGVQLEIAETLGKIGSEIALEYLTKNWKNLSHPKARRTAIKALGQIKNKKSVETIEQALIQDQSPLVQYEAGIALGKLQLTDGYERLTKALDKRKSWRDHYNRGIIKGLSELRHDERVFEVLKKYLKLGQSMFVRRETAEAVSNYGQARPNLIFNLLSDLTRDENYFVKLTAISALEHLGDSRAIPALQRMSDTFVDPRIRRHTVTAMKELRKGSTHSEQVTKLTGEMDRLKEQYRDVLSKLQEFEKFVLKKDA